MSDEIKKILQLKKSELAKAVLQLKGKPLDLEEYKPFEMIYNVSPPEVTAVAGRQLGKSASMGGMTIIEAILRPYFNTIYLAPLAQQASRFSSAYLDPFLYSPIIRKHYMDTSTKKNVFEKSLNNGSRIYVAYAETEQDADRVRGASGDQLLLDEIQDMSMEAIPILRETLAASDYGFVRYMGTAKTENNTLEINWRRSNMMQWVIRCTHCAKYTIPIDFEICMKIMDNPEGPGCVHCGKVINMKTGVWMAGRPQEKNHLGFHLPQIIIPARNTPKKWRELRDKVLNGGYSMQKVCNEVFGIASGVGGRILTMKEAMACCDPQRTQWDTKFPHDDRHIVCTVLGVDWSTTGSTKSYTIISVLGYDFTGKCYLLYSQKLDGIDILDQVRRVEELYTQFNCTMIGSDRGVGVLQGQMMKRHLGEDRVNMVNYVSAKHTLRWDKDGQFFSADRTTNMDTMFLKAKMGADRFSSPAWSLTGDFWQDALNIFEEESHTGKRLYRKDEDLCDDWFHSIVFANIAHMVVKEEFVYQDEPAQDDIYNF
jgi:hypothetical protein